MPKQPETRLQVKIRKALEKKYPGSFWFKVHGGPYQRMGIPDLLGCIDGYYIALEVKTKKGKPSDIQIETIKLIITAGGFSCVVRSPEETLRKVKKWLKSKQSSTAIKRRQYVKH